MDSNEFRDFGKATVDYIADYIENARDRNVLPSVEPGYLSALLPEEAPVKPEPWQNVLQDVERVIMPGATHWISPRFHAYFPCGHSYPSIVGEMLSAGISCIGFSWMASPACTELEVVTMNWLGKLLGIPKEFLNCSEGPGGGVIQGSASEATLVCLLAAKERTTRRIMKLNPDIDEATIKGKLVAYTSDQANSSVEKAGLLGSMTMRHLASDEKYRLRGSTLLEAMKKDEEAGLYPCYVISTLGTTGTCAYDCLNELGPICNERNVWLHVDAAYAGAALICPEFRHLMTGIEYADSFDFNPHKWMLVSFDCSALWVKNAQYLIETSNVDRTYLNHGQEGKAPDYRHWQIPLGRRFRSLKLWFVLRIYGVDGIQSYIRSHVSLARYFEKLVLSDERFETAAEVTLGLVCFRIKGDNSLTKELLNRLSARKKIYLVACMCGDKYVIRFAVCSPRCDETDVDFAWNEITGQTEEILTKSLPTTSLSNRINNKIEEHEDNNVNNKLTNVVDKTIGRVTEKFKNLNNTSPTIS